MASFFVHPESVMDQKARNTYTQLLAMLAQRRKENRAWIALPREVARWWRHRSQMKLIRHGDSWFFDGPLRVFVHAWPMLGLRTASWSIS
jgi:hypothetical protein